MKQLYDMVSWIFVLLAFWAMQINNPLAAVTLTAMAIFFRLCVLEKVVAESKAKQVVNLIGHKRVERLAEDDYQVYN